MFKSLIAGATALSLTFAAASPAQANNWSNDDLGKLLFGLVAAATLNAAINNKERQSDADSARTAQPVIRAPQVHVPSHHDRNVQNRNGGINDAVRRTQPNLLPRTCLRTVETSFGNHTILGRRCLNNNYRRISELPRRCSVRLYTDRGPVNGYDLSCLREQGYRIRRH